MRGNKLKIRFTIELDIKIPTVYFYTAVHLLDSNKNYISQNIELIEYLKCLQENEYSLKKLYFNCLIFINIF